MLPPPDPTGIPWHATPARIAAALHVSDLETGLATSEAVFRQDVVKASAWSHALGHPRLCALAAGKALALRDGEVRELPMFEIVQGDVILVRAGDLVPADARLIVVRELFCDERELSGRAISGKSVHEVAPNAPLPRRHSMIFCGSRVLHGSGRAIVVATGLETEIGRQLVAEETALGQIQTIRGEPLLADAPK